MWTPRDYQVEAIDAGLDALAAGEDSLIVIPTGGGKSGVIGTITKSLVDDFDGLRVVNVTHVAELIDQNYRELVGMWDWAPAGIYSAGLGRKEMGSRIVFAGIQSIHGKAKQLGQVDVLQVDEAHLIPRNSQTMYGRFIEDVRRYNPDCRLIGFTATDYRTDSGKLTDPSWGKDGSEVPPLFKKIAYEVGIRRLIDDGYLAGLITKQTATTLSVGGVAKRDGDFVPGQLQAAVDRDNITRPIVQEIIEYGQSRKSWLIFCSGVEHANHVAEEIRRQGYTCGTITGDTDSGVRARMIEDFKAGRLRALTNAQVLTTGFNAPGVDLLAMIRPTESAGLYVQICLDESTEILTKNGWRFVDGVGEDDLVAGYDLKTQKIHWQKVEQKVDRSLVEGESMIGVAAPHLEFCVTNNHNLVVACRSSRLKRGDVPAWKLETAETVSSRKSNILVPVAGYIDAPGAPLTDAEVAFLGWFLSDGTLSRKNNAISISQQVTSREIGHLKDTLDACGFRYGTFIYKRNNQYADNARFGISHGDARIQNGTGLKGWSRLSAFINSDKVITEAYDDLDRRQMLILLDALNRGDGSKPRNPSWVPATYSITCGIHGDLADRIQALCVTRGIRCNITHQKGGSNITLRACPTKDRAVIGGASCDSDARDRSSIGDWDSKPGERVWCVTTRMGTIVTRRSGKVIIMGNCGRGTRPLYAPGHDLSTREGRLAAIAAGSKPNCLVLDFAGNIRRHGPIDMVQPRRPGKGGGDAPVKTCPECFSVIHASVMECPDCGHVFERQLSEKITRTAAAAPILSTAEPAWVKVTRRSFHRHEKFGALPSVRVEYWRGIGQIIAKEWLAVENPKATGLVKSWWKSCGGAEPAPTSVDDALERVGELRPISEIRIEPDGKFWRVTGRKFGGDAEDEVEKPCPKWGGANRYEYAADLDDEIPF